MIYIKKARTIKHTSTASQEPKPSRRAASVIKPPVRDGMQVATSRPPISLTSADSVDTYDPVTRKTERDRKCEVSHILNSPKSSSTTQDPRNAKLQAIINRNPKMARLEVVKTYNDTNNDKITDGILKKLVDNGAVFRKSIYRVHTSQFLRTLQDVADEHPNMSYLELASEINSRGGETITDNGIKSLVRRKRILFRQDKEPGIVITDKMRTSIKTFVPAGVKKNKVETHRQWCKTYNKQMSLKTFDSIRKKP